jgi:glycosyltransferase involved in cell wall biosynthesis
VAPTVVHVTVVHPVDDIRIFAKQCRSLAAAGYDVHLVAPAESDRELGGVKVHALTAAPGGRLSRMTRTVLAAYRTARRLDADLYHVHDPELMPIALLLRAQGRRVVYDSHEHLPQQVSTKPWIPAPLRRPLAALVDLAERNAARMLSAVVTAEPYVRERFEGRAPRVVTVNNYPMLDAFPAADGDWDARERAVCYAGSITELRGIREMIAAVAMTDATLLLAGHFAPAGLERDLEAEPGWGQVQPLGRMLPEEVAGVYARARAGLVVLHPVPNYLEANPTKMFEYMSAGLPVIASDFPAWAAMVDGHGCGICVDPRSPEAIAEAIRWVLDHPEEARAMGARGRAAVERNYSWDAELAVLLDLYAGLIGAPALEPGHPAATVG